MAFADVFPMVALSVFSGAISDRIGYLRVIKAMQLCYIAVGVAFTLLLHFDAMTIYICLGLTICHGITEAMSTPPRLALVNALVGRDELSSAVALNSATFNACRLVGPGIGGALLVLVKEGVIGADVVFALATIAFVQLYIVVFFLPAKGAGGEGKVSMALLRDMADGAVYVWRSPGIRFLMLVLGMTGLFIRPFMELASGYADVIFGMPEEALGAILSTIGGGAMLSCLWLARRGRTEGLTRLCTHSFALLALALLVFTFINVGDGNCRAVSYSERGWCGNAGSCPELFHSPELGNASLWRAPRRVGLLHDRHAADHCWRCRYRAGFLALGPSPGTSLRRSAGDGKGAGKETSLERSGARLTATVSRPILALQENITARAGLLPGTVFVF